MLVLGMDVKGLGLQRSQEGNWLERRVKSLDWESRTPWPRRSTLCSAGTIRTLSGSGGDRRSWFSTGTAGPDCRRGGRPKTAAVSVDVEMETPPPRGISEDV